MGDNNFSGYGLLGKKVMEDSELSIEAKGIYAYLSSHADIYGHTWPSVDKICSDLNISPNRFYKHSHQLRQKGYLSSKRVLNPSTGNFYNLYQLHDDIYQRSFDKELRQAHEYHDPDLDSMFETPDSRFELLQNEDTNINIGVLEFLG